MKSLSEVIADFYIEKNIISSDMKSVYVYGISLIINDIIDFAVILIPAIIAQRFIYGVAFLLTFCITRIRCGGFHAKKSWICAGVMLLTFILICLCIELTTSIYGVILNVIINSISILIMLPIIPIENPNKKLDADVKQKNKKIGIIVTSLFAMLSIVLTVYNIQEGAVISFTLLSVAVLAMVGKILNQGGEKNEKNIRYSNDNYS